jgi:hypothetical protein
MGTIRRAKAILGMDTTVVGALLAGTKGIYSGMSANVATFPSPVPPLSTMQTQMQAVADAQATVETRVRGATTTRNAKRAILMTTLEQLVTYVQGVADAAGPAQAPMIIELAGMKVAAVGRYQKPVLSAKPGVTGTALLFANAKLLSGGSKKKSFFTWQHTIDGGKTFLTTMLPTATARTSVTGLTSMTSVGFRVAITLAGKPQGDWTQVIYMTVP